MKNIPTVYELRKSGWKVKVGHFRNLYRFCPKTGKKTGKHDVVLSEWREKYQDFYLSANGGKTVITLKAPNSDVEFIGETKCSENDKYNRFEGLKKALCRAISQTSYIKNV